MIITIKYQNLVACAVVLTTHVTWPHDGGCAKKYPGQHSKLLQHHALLKPVVIKYLVRGNSMVSLVPRSFGTHRYVCSLIITIIEFWILLHYSGPYTTPPFMNAAVEKVFCYICSLFSVKRGFHCQYSFHHQKNFMNLCTYIQCVPFPFSSPKVTLVRGYLTMFFDGPFFKNWGFGWVGAF